MKLAMSETVRQVCRQPHAFEGCLTDNNLTKMLLSGKKPHSTCCAMNVNRFRTEEPQMKAIGGFQTRPRPMFTRIHPRLQRAILPVGVLRATFSFPDSRRDIANTDKMWGRKRWLRDKSTNNTACSTRSTKHEARGKNCATKIIYICLFACLRFVLRCFGKAGADGQDRPTAE